MKLSNNADVKGASLIEGKWMLNSDRQRQEDSKKSM